MVTCTFFWWRTVQYVFLARLVVRLAASPMRRLWNAWQHISHRVRVHALGVLSCLTNETIEAAPISCFPCAYDVSTFLLVFTMCSYVVVVEQLTNNVLLASLQQPIVCCVEYVGLVWCLLAGCLLWHRACRDAWGCVVCLFVFSVPGLPSFSQRLASSSC